MRNGERATNVRSAQCHVRRFGAREARPRVCPISSVRLPPHDRFHPSVASNRGDRFGDDPVVRRATDRIGRGTSARSPSDCAPSAGAVSEAIAPFPGHRHPAYSARQREDSDVRAGAACAIKNGLSIGMDLHLD